MADLSADVIRNLDAEVTTVRVNGVLDLQTVAKVRAVLLKVIAECPAVVVVDVSGCTAAHPAALTVFPAMTRHHAWQPAVAVSLAGADASFLTHGGRAALGNVPAYASTESASEAAAVTRDHPARVVYSPPSAPEGPGRARAVMVDACRRWGLPELEVPATLVVSELVTNAIIHANGRLLLDATVRGHYLHVRVHDASAREPVIGPPLDQADARRDRGRGLRLVERYSSAWGFLPRADGRGKVVWATLRVHPTDAG